MQPHGPLVDVFVVGVEADGFLHEGEGGGGVRFGVGEPDVGVKDVAADGFPVRGQPQPVVPVGDGSGVELDDLVEGKRVLAGVDGGGGVAGDGG